MDDIHFEMTKIKNKLKDLSNLHDKHLNRPTLDDNIDEEKSIDNLTQEITNVNKHLHIFALFETFSLIPNYLFIFLDDKSMSVEDKKAVGAQQRGRPTGIQQQSSSRADRSTAHEERGQQSGSTAARVDH